MAATTSATSACAQRRRCSVAGHAARRRRRRRVSRAVCTSADMSFSEGMRVKVTGDVCVFHAPGSAKTGLNLKGFEGVVVRIADNHKGTPISATHVVKVELTLQAGEKLKKFQTHFMEQELEAI